MVVFLWLVSRLSIRSIIHRVARHKAASGSEIDTTPCLFPIPIAGRIGPGTTADLPRAGGFRRIVVIILISILLRQGIFGGRFGRSQFFPGGYSVHKLSMPEADYCRIRVIAAVAF